MHWVDDPKPRLLGRTPREVLLMAIGVGYCAYEISTGDPQWINLAMYALATVTFALRFFPARAIGVGVGLGALAQRLPELRLSWDELTCFHTWAAIVVIALLASKDLEARFDRAPSRIGWLPNAWASLPVRDVRMLRACIYAIGALAAVLSYTWGGGLVFGAPSVHPAIIVGSIAGLGLVIALLAFGRAPALLLVPLACAPIGIVAALQIPDAEQAIALAWPYALSGPFAGTPCHVIPIVALSALAMLLAAPYQIRLLHRAAFG